MTIKQKDINVTLNGWRPNPNDNIEINSLSFFNFMKHKRSPKISINGRITVIKFGIKYNESIKTSNIWICMKFVTVKSLVICNNQAIDKKINKIKRKYFVICENK